MRSSYSVLPVTFSIRIVVMSDSQHVRVIVGGCMLERLRGMIASLRNGGPGRTRFDNLSSVGHIRSIHSARISPNCVDRRADAEQALAVGASCIARTPSAKM